MVETVSSLKVMWTGLLTPWQQRWECWCHTSFHLSLFILPGSPISGTGGTHVQGRSFLLSESILVMPSETYPEVLPSIS